MAKKNVDPPLKLVLITSADKRIKTKGSPGLLNCLSTTNPGKNHGILVDILNNSGW